MKEIVIIVHKKEVNPNGSIFFSDRVKETIINEIQSSNQGFILIIDLLGLRITNSFPGVISNLRGFAHENGVQLFLRGCNAEDQQMINLFGVGFLLEPETVNQKMSPIGQDPKFHHGENQAGAEALTACKGSGKAVRPLCKFCKPTP